MGRKILQVLKLLNEGRLVGFPTETVYALAASPYSESAINSIYQAKKREKDKPLALLAANIESAEKIAVFNDYARSLAQKHWPGALTLILPLKKDSNIAKNINVINNSIGVRVPNHPLALEILNEFASPIVATSTNLTSMKPALYKKDVDPELLNHISILLDSDVEPSGTASTVIDATGKRPVVLRQGDIIL